MKDYEDENRKRLKRRKKAMLKKSQKKAGVAFLVFAVLLIILVGKISLINYGHGDAYSMAVLDHQTYTSTTIPYKRGQILSSNGTVLAYSEKVYNLIMDPKIMLSDDAYKEPTLKALVDCFGLSRTDLEGILASKPDSRYEKLLKLLTSDQIAPFKKLQNDTQNNPNIKGVWFEETYIRKYPFSTLACNAIGFSSINNGGETGIEEYYNEQLSGTDGITYSYVDGNLDVQETTKDAIDGYNVVTTIDYNIQSIIEKKIKEYNDQYPSKATSVMVMNPNDGSILGMASYPFYDLNNPRDISSLSDEYIESCGKEDDSREKKETQALGQLWKNYCLSENYEPGSTFKSFTVASGLEEGVVHDGDSFFCKGFEEVGGYTIRCHTFATGGHGTLTLEQALAYSCNPSMMQISAKIGGIKFAQYEKLFGFGSKTGIDLPGEEAGIVIPELSATDLATNSFGQNINVTMVQMGAAFSSLINGGNYYQPHIMKQIEKQSGEIMEKYDTTLVRQTVTDSTSQMIRKYLKASVEYGGGSGAAVEGYSIGGKTGTAQKVNRDEKKWVISFIGAAPIESPQVVVYVVIDEPFGSTGTDGSSSDHLNLSNAIFSEILPYMSIYRDKTAISENNKQQTTTDANGNVQGQQATDANGNVQGQQATDANGNVQGQQATDANGNVQGQQATDANGNVQGQQATDANGNVQGQPAANANVNNRDGAHEAVSIDIENSIPTTAASPQ